MLDSSSFLEKGQIVPAFSLPGADGMPHSPWDYKQREHLLLLFTRGSGTSEGRGVLRAFAHQYSDFREESCAILAVTADTVIVNLETQEKLRLPFALLANPQGDVIAKYTHWEAETRMLTPSIVLADRYGVVYMQGSSQEEAQLPPIAELLASLQYLNSICTP
jgi:peroxiredoxin